MLLTMYDGRTRLSSDVADEVRSLLRRPRLRDRRAAQRPPGRGAQPRRSRSTATTPAPPAPTPTTGWRWRSSSVAETTKPRRGLGRGLAALVAEFPSGQVSLDRARAVAGASEPATAPASSSTRMRSGSWPTRSAPRASCSRSSSGRPGEGYEIIAGERRWRAAQRAGLRDDPGDRAPGRRAREPDPCPCRERRPRGSEPGRAGAGYAVLADELDLTQTEIARRLGKSRPAVANTHAAARAARRGAGPDRRRRSSVRGPRPRLLQVSGQDERLALARRAIDRGLSVRADRGRGQARTGRKPKPARRRRRDGRRAGAPGRGCRLAVARTCGRRFAGARAAAASSSHFSSAAELGRIVDQLRAERVSWAD